MKKGYVGSRLMPLLLVAATSVACTSPATPEVSTVTPTNVNPTNFTPTNVSVTTSIEPVSYDNGDEYSDWKLENPTYMELKGSSTLITGPGAAQKGNAIMIVTPGTYVFSGKLDNGQIVVDAETKGTVRLVLNGVDIQSKDNAPIYVKKADKAIITLQDGTKNTVSDGQTYLLLAGEDEPNAAIFSKDDLTINGTGTLTVRGNYNNGIMSKDDLTITGGNIAIYAADDGLVGRDRVVVKAGKITIEAGGDGIKTTNDTDPAKGYIAFEGGSFDIKSGADGIQAQTSIQITGGQYTIITNGGSANGVVKIADNGPTPRGGVATVQKPAATKSAKGLKASTDILIAGGTFKIDSADDALHSNNSITIAGGEISITSGDDGVHADSAILIQAGKIDITKSYEGIESKLITISGGETHVVSSDDGINITGGNDGSSVNGRPGQNTFSSSGNNALHIQGGYVTVDALGDGIDANGAIYMSNGTVVVHGPTANNNGPLDYDAGFELTGGVLVAAGSAGMVQAPSNQSSQYSVAMIFTKVQPAGALVSLQDGNGKSLLTFAPKRQYQSVVISSPELRKDATYTLYTGGTATGNVSDGLNLNGVYQGGSKIVSFPTSTVVTWLTEAGVSSKPAGGFMRGRP